MRDAAKRGNDEMTRTTRTSKMHKRVRWEGTYLPTFLPAHPKLADLTKNVTDNPNMSDMHTFLRSRMPYTILPPPGPPLSLDKDDNKIRMSGDIEYVQVGQRPRCRSSRHRPHCCPQRRRRRPSAAAIIPARAIRDSLSKRAAT